MLKGIPPVISPELMYVLMCMGHGEEIVLADADFPALTHAKKIIRLDGVRTADLLDAILLFFPLDPFVERPVASMDCSPWGPEPESYEVYRRILRRHCTNFTDFELMERFDYYRRAECAAAVVVTSEPDGNVLLKKGPVN